MLYGGPDTSPMRPEQFVPPAGSFLVGYLDDRPAGSAAWRRLTAVQAASALVTAEIKRVFVDPSSRRRGLARELMVALETDAHAAGVKRLVLETGPMQPPRSGSTATSATPPRTVAPGRSTQDVRTW